MNNDDLFDAMLENTLDALPREPLPPSLIANVMAQIAPQPQVEPFRLHSADIWLALTLAFGVVCILFVGGSLELDSIMLTLPDLRQAANHLTADWRQFTSLLVGIELLLAIVIYLGFSVGPNWRDFETIATR